MDSESVWQEARRDRDFHESCCRQRQSYGAEDVSAMALGLTAPLLSDFAALPINSTHCPHYASPFQAAGAYGARPSMIAFDLYFPSLIPAFSELPAISSHKKWRWVFLLR
jgi:hypothetical protein